MIVAVIIATWFVIMTSLITGYLLCLYAVTPTEVKKVLDRKLRKPKAIGTVTRPTAEVINKRGTIEAEGEEEFAKQLRKVGIKSPVET